MAVKLKPLGEQVIVITGASSGIGLVTARMAAKAGAKVVLAARSEDAIRSLANEINNGAGQGGQAIYVVADVADQNDVRSIADAAIEAFGGFDTWVNNAGVSIYGELTRVPVEDMRQLFDTNVWGLLYGSLEAVKHFKVYGGALINIGSVLSDRAVPLQGAYCASKHAVKGFTDALRMELEAENAPISISLIKPGPIDTPYTQHAKNYMEAEPTHVPPVYAPEAVARAIVHCAQVPTRDVYVGSTAKAIAGLGHQLPGVADKVEEAVFIKGSKSKHPPHDRADNGLDRPSGELLERGDYEGYTRPRSLYTDAKLNPLIAGAAIAGAGLVLAALLKERQGSGTNTSANGGNPGKNNAQTGTGSYTAFTEAGTAPESLTAPASAIVGETYPTHTATVTTTGVSPISAYPSASSIREHMEVLGSDGQHVGTVDKVEGSHIKLTKNDFEAGGVHHLLPLALVATVDGQVRLTVSASEAQSRWTATA